MGLTIDQLVSPMPSGVFPGVTPLTVQPGTWLYRILQNAGSLPVTAWQPGGVAWTELLIFATQLATGDVGISLVAQGGLLDFASTGTVTYTDANGNSVTVPVTPDPSIPGQNPTGAPGWLDALGQSTCDETRLQATYASGQLYYANTTGATLGTYAAGAFHANNSFNGVGYSNVDSAFTFSASPVAGTSIASVTFSPGGASIACSTPHGLTTGAVVYAAPSDAVLATNWAIVTVTSATAFTMNGVGGTGAGGPGGKVYIPGAAPFKADAIGPGYNASPGQISSTTTSVPGGFVNNFFAFSGAPWESNPAFAARCRAKLQSLSVNGPKGAQEYWALSADRVLRAQSPAQSLVSPPNRVAIVLGVGSGIIQCTIASPAGAVPGVTNRAIQGATNASPIVLQTFTTAGLSTGMTTLISGVEGNTAANGYFTLTVIDGTHFSLDGSTGNGAYVANTGVIEAGDLGLVDAVLQRYAVPNATTLVTQSASPLAVNVSATVYVPSEFLADYGANPFSNKGTIAIVSYLTKIRIGGIKANGSSNIIPYSAISDEIFDAGTSAGQKYTVSVNNLRINGAAVDLALNPIQVATVGTINIAVQGV